MRTGLHSNRRNRASEMEARFPILPTFIIKYNFENFKYIKKTKCPIYIFQDKKRSFVELFKIVTIETILQKRR